MWRRLKQLFNERYDHKQTADTINLYNYPHKNLLANLLALKIMSTYLKPANLFSSSAKKNQICLTIC